MRPFGKAEPFERSLRVFPEKTARSHDQLVELLLVLGDIEKVVHGPDKQFALAAVIPDQALAQRPGWSKNRLDRETPRNWASRTGVLGDRGRSPLPQSLGKFPVR